MTIIPANMSFFIAPQFLGSQAVKRSLWALIITICLDVLASPFAAGHTLASVYSVSHFVTLPIAECANTHTHTNLSFVFVSYAALTYSDVCDIFLKANQSAVFPCRIRCRT